MNAVLGIFLSVMLWPALATAGVDETWPVTLDSGRVLNLHVQRPNSVDDALPAVMLFGGFQGAAEILEYVKAEEPLVRASFRYPWSEPDKITLWTIPAIVDGFAQAVRDTFDGIARLSALLREHPAVDPQRIILVGASAGAPFATIGGADNAIPAVIIVQGFGRLTDVIAHQFVLSWTQQFGDWVKPIAWLFAAFIVWWAELPVPEDHAARFTESQQLLVINAADDQRIPRQAIEALWDGVAASEAQASRLDLAGDHLRGYGDPAMDTIMAVALDWMRGRGLISASHVQLDER